jgi:hypothetical protein
MHLSAMAVPVLLALCVAHPQPGRGQTVSVAAATGPSFLPGSGDLGDWHGLVGVGIERKALGARLEAMYEGVADKGGLGFGTVAPEPAVAECDLGDLAS